jgi:hypothetical protein
MGAGRLHALNIWPGGPWRRSAAATTTVRRHGKGLVLWHVSTAGGVNEKQVCRWGQPWGLSPQRPSGAILPGPDLVHLVRLLWGGWFKPVANW